MSDKKDIFSSGPTSLPNSEEIHQYLQGEMDAKKAHAFEKKMLESELFSDAVEGFANIKDKAKVQFLLTGLNEQILKKTKRPSVFTLSKVAAGLLIIAAVGASFWWINRSADENVAVSMQNDAPKKQEELKFTPPEQEVKGNALVKPLEIDRYNAWTNSDQPIVTEDIQLKDLELTQELPESVANSKELAEDQYRSNGGEYHYNVMDSTKIILNESIDRRRLASEPTPGNASQPTLTNAATNISSDKLSKNVVVAESKYKQTAKMNNEEEKKTKSASPPMDIAKPSKNNSPKYLANKKNAVSSGASAQAKSDVETKSGTQLIKEAKGFYEARDYARCDQWLDNVLRQEPQNQEANYYSGMANYELKRYSKSIAALEKVQSTSEYYEEAQWTLYKAYLANNEAENAKKALEKVKSMGKKRKAEAEILLDSLK